VTEPLVEALWEAPGLPRLDLPDELVTLYAGPFGLRRPALVANFVETLDGVVSIPSLAGSNALIADESRADRFVMALLRSCADAILIGSGTLHGSPRSRWTPTGPYPDAADALAELRRRLGLPPRPLLAVMTGSGTIDVGHPALEEGALVLTTAAGAEQLAGLVFSRRIAEVLPGELHVDPAEAVAALRRAGAELVLAEAGPHVFGSLLAGGLVDELFLTVSPLLAGHVPAPLRLGLVEGVDLLPSTPVHGRLLSLRRGGDHLLLRYEVAPPQR